MLCGHFCIIHYSFFIFHFSLKENNKLVLYFTLRHFRIAKT